MELFLDLILVNPKTDMTTMWELGIPKELLHEYGGRGSIVSYILTS